MGDLADRKTELVAIYRRYGFVLQRTAANDAALVFTLKTGYFDNAEIIKLNPDFDTSRLFAEFSASGYACTVRDAKPPADVEEDLFDGFFSVESTHKRLREDYRRFADSLVKPYGPSAEYTYIKAPYQIDSAKGEYDVPYEVLSRIDSDGPILFLIEAAAGFGKTCTAQEIAKLLSESHNRLPLYAELSRNRQARIFRYILLDEIDRTFPLLSSQLVHGEINSGRISVILDGFDELLRKGEEGEGFDRTEPMLETVSELLTGKAKIIITTRRTVLFDGDDFHQWLERHANDFSVVRIRIQEPRISDWLSHDRRTTLEHSGLDLNAIANPVLLSYLRCVDNATFSSSAQDPDRVVQSYFDYMLERERGRQDLRMTPEIQASILTKIAADMIDKGYTAEDRDYFVKMLLIDCFTEIEAARNQYSASDKPSREEIANKLASHALLDRSVDESTKIGFVNEFALGNYVAANVLASDEWLCDELRFIEPAVKSYAPRTRSARSALFFALQSSIPFLTIRAQIEISAELNNRLPDNLANNSVDDLELSGLTIGASVISSFQFNNVTFKNCTLNTEALNNVTFLACRFFGCDIIGDYFAGAVYVLGCESSPELALPFENPAEQVVQALEVDQNRAAEASVLKRFWPVGDCFDQKPTRPTFKLMKHLCQTSEDLSSMALYSATQRLLRAGILTHVRPSGLIRLNMDNINKAQVILRQAI